MESETLLITELELLNMSGSETAEVTKALFVKLEHTFNLPRMVMFVVPRGLTGPNENMILVPPVTEVWAGVAETKVTPAGNVFVTFTDVAWSGPEFPTVIV